ncbi:MAG: AIR synthase-related protein, partial [Bdellovibrionota bacterium]
MIDISDGLANELSILCEKKGLGITIEAADIPIHTESLIEGPDKALHRAIWGGEEYELLLVVSPAQKSEFLSKVQALGLKVYRLGAFDSSSEIALINSDGTSKILKEHEGWSHF